MSHRPLVLTALVLTALSLACTGGSEGEPVTSPPNPGDADTDTDTDSDTDLDTGWLEPDEPAFTASFDGEAWEAEAGHWLAGGDSYLVGTVGETEVVIVVDGDVSKRGEYDLVEATYFETIHNGYAFQYETTGGSASFVVEGHDAGGDYLWGSLDGELELTDSVAGGTLSLDGLELHSWLRYGAR